MPHRNFIAAIVLRRRVNTGSHPEPDEASLYCDTETIVSEQRVRSFCEQRRPRPLSAATPVSWRRRRVIRRCRAAEGSSDDVGGDQDAAGAWRAAGFGDLSDQPSPHRLRPQKAEGEVALFRSTPLERLVPLV